MHSPAATEISVFLLITQSQLVTKICCDELTVCCCWSHVTDHTSVWPNLFFNVVSLVSVKWSDWMDKCVDDVMECSSTQHAVTVGIANSHQCGESLSNVWFCCSHRLCSSWWMYQYLVFMHSWHWTRCGQLRWFACTMQCKAAAAQLTLSVVQWFSRMLKLIDYAS